MSETNKKPRTMYSKKELTCAMAKNTGPDVPASLVARG